MRIGNFFGPKGFSSLVVLIVVGLITIVAVQINSIQNKTPLTQTSSQPKNQPAKESLDIKTQTEYLNKYLITEAALLGVTENISLYFKDTQSDKEVTLEPVKSWIPASTIKSYVLLEVFRQKRLGLINFDNFINIKAENVVPTELETDEFPRLREGTRVTIKQLAEAMIIQSDNTAYNTLLDILDRRNINTSLKSLGITETVVGEKLNLDGGQFQLDLKVPGRQPNTTTVKDLATLFSLLYAHKVPDSEEMLAVFKRQKISNMIPARLPENTVVAHKTGDWAPIYHDGGIVYKPDDPFVFVIFTNSGDPTIVAKLAQVAYYQDPKYVGKNLTFQPLPKKMLASGPIYFNPPEQVLGELSSEGNAADITAEDLGVTSKDLMVDSKQANDVNPAWITPGSLFYPLKKVNEKGQLIFSFSNHQKANSYLTLANNRLSEIKSLLSHGQVERIDSLLSEATQDMKNAINLAKNDSQKDKLIIEIKKTHDLFYALMEQSAQSIPDDKKSQFVDAVYNFYQKGKAEISPVINSSVIVNPTKQKPTIGLVDKISGDKMTLRFDDGSAKIISLSSATKVRSVDQDTSEELKTVKVGNKVAVLGPNGTDTVMDAQFILNNIPQGLTDQHRGRVAEVNPGMGVIKVIDQKGQVNLVKVTDNTAVKSKDTNVSLEGIKAGSQVIIFGTSGPIESTKSAKPDSSPSAPKQSGTSQNQPTPKSSPIPIYGSKQTSQSSPAPSSSTVEIKATSVTVVGNSPGKNEKKQSIPSSNNQNPPQPSTSQPNSQKSSGSINNSTSNNQNLPSNKKDSKK